MTHGIGRLRYYLARNVRTDRAENGVALMSTILFMFLLGGLSLVLLSTILTQLNASYGATKSTRTVNASQAGLQAGLAIMRSAASDDPLTPGFGDRSKLPCTVLTGSVDGENADVKYSVSFKYYEDDPATVGAGEITCVPGSGPSEQPRYVVVTSEGQAPSRAGVDDAEGNRKVAATYQFRVTNINIPGGRIFNFDKTKCLEAEGTSANSRIRFVPAAQCANTAKDDVQSWIYDTTYQIKLASSTVGGGDELCITDPNPTSSSVRDARLQKCLTNSTRYTQLWSWTGDHSWRGQKNPISNGVSNTCLRSADARLTVDDSCNGGFAPTAAAGAGAAGKATNQIVNYKEFGRCLDVTGENIDATYMIAYPCKQDPTTGQTYLKWNHKWYYSEPPVGQTSLADQQIVVQYLDKPTDRRCLQAPQDGDGWGAYPRFKACNASNAHQKWTRVQKASDYASSYVFTDYRGRCLTADATDTLDGNWSKITVTACTGSTAQKWNAPSTANDAEFGDFKEIQG